MSAALQIVAVPAFADNYIWLVREPATGEVAVVDPGDGAAALAAADRLGWRIGTVLITHWHPDHTGGIGQVVEATGATVFGPQAERGKFAGLEHGLADGDSAVLGGQTAAVWAVPGHTLGHIAYVFRDAGVAFVGDTLFAMGCGRLFEGTPEQMHGSLQRLASLPEDTILYPAHEYTLSNARFAAHADPESAAVQARLAEVEGQRARGEMTVPAPVGLERATNPFVRARDAAVFAQLRSAKDSFR